MDKDTAPKKGWLSKHFNFKSVIGHLANPLMIAMYVGMLGTMFSAAAAAGTPLAPVDAIKGFAKGLYDMTIGGSLDWFSGGWDGLTETFNLAQDGTWSTGAEINPHAGHAGHVMAADGSHVMPIADIHEQFGEWLNNTPPDQLAATAQKAGSQYHMNLLDYFTSNIMDHSAHLTNTP